MLLFTMVYSFGPIFIPSVNLHCVNYVPGTILDAQNKSVSQAKTAVLEGIVF